MCKPWSRLLDINWKFYECLAASLPVTRIPKKDALTKLRTWEGSRKNETDRKSVDYIMSKRFGYLQYGPDAKAPVGVLVVTAHMDTQDNGFYLVIRGWGQEYGNLAVTA